MDITTGEASVPTPAQTSSKDDGLPKMVNDLGVSAPMGTEELRQIKSLCPYNLYRARAESWAFKDISFLVFDEAPESDDDEDVQLAWALKLSEQDDRSKQPKPGSSADPDGGGHDDRSEASSDDDDPSSEWFTYGGSRDRKKKPEPCRICAFIPEFPPDRNRPRKLRLFCPGKELSEELLSRSNPCQHYVAVSYCWKRTETLKTTAKFTYQVRKTNGERVLNLADDETIDRAIDFALTCGLRMIWLDKECLEQKEGPDREAGLQAMDIVYNRALITAGLHDTIITNRTQVIAIQQFQGDTWQQVFGDTEGKHQYEESSSAGLPLASTVPLVLDFLNSVNSERWYTRAWIAQEAVSSGEGLCLVFRLGPDVAVRGINRRLRFKHPLRPPPLGSTGRSPRLPLQWYLTVAEFRSLVAQLDVLYAKVASQAIVDSVSALRSFAIPILDAAKALRPIRPTTKGFGAIVIGGASYGARPRLDAAGALTLLKARTCSRVHDLMAIVANLCGYDIRLETGAIRLRCQSIRIALLALAILNGDLSLFVPEVYTAYAVHPLAVGPGLGLLQPFDTEAGAIDSRSMNIGSRVTPRSTMHLRAHDMKRVGLGISAYIWNVDDTLDLSSIQKNWSGFWYDLKGCLANDQAGEPQHELGSDHDMDHGNTKMEPLSPSLILGDDAKEDQLARIVFGILRDLRDLSETDERALGVANSIWQSIRVGPLGTVCVPGMESVVQLPDEVCAELFENPIVEMQPIDTLQLDVSPDGKCFNQLWVVDRIMAFGCLWVGRYVPAPQPDEADWARFLEYERARKAPDTTGEASSQSDEQRVEDHVEEDTTPTVAPTEFEFPKPGEIFDETDEMQFISDELTSSRDARFKTIMGRQFMLEMFASIANVQSQEHATSLHWAPGMSRNQLTLLAHLLDSDCWTPEADARRERELVSVFDVDGPCTVATSYNSEWEVLPHPTIRSLSMCWVVKLVPADGEIPLVDDVNDEAPSEVMSSVGPRVRVGRSGGWVGHNEERGRCEYDVVAKVKGLWAIMEVPKQMYLFR